jgi:hypothetical protein
MEKKKFYIATWIPAGVGRIFLWNVPKKPDQPWQHCTEPAWNENRPTQNQIRALARGYIIKGQEIKSGHN